MAKKNYKWTVKWCNSYIYVIHNSRELSEKPYMIITQVPKMHLEKIMFVNYHCFTFFFFFNYGFKHILKFQVALRKATSLVSFSWRSMGWRDEEDCVIQVELGKG